MKFSVIVPAYNVYDYLTECIESIVNQVINNEFTVEVLLVDDGSTDNKTPDLCDKLSLKYPQTRVIHQQNGGLSAARNTGIRHATGDYLLFVDGDDFWGDKEFLLKIYQHLKLNAVDLVLFSYSHYYNPERIIPFEGKEVTGIIDLEKNALKLTAERTFGPSAWTKIIQSRLFDNPALFFPEGFLSEDCLWSAELLQAVKTCSYFSSTQYMYRQNRIGSITNVIKEKNVLDILKSIDIALQNEKTHSKSISNALRVYLCIAYLYTLPSVYNYLYNPEIKHKLNNLVFLLDYAHEIKDKGFKIRGIMAKVLGILGTAYILKHLKILHNLLKKLK